MLKHKFSVIFDIWFLLESWVWLETNKCGYCSEVNFLLGWKLTDYSSSTVVAGSVSKIIWWVQRSISMWNCHWYSIKAPVGQGEQALLGQIQPCRPGYYVQRGERSWNLGWSSCLSHFLSLSFSDRAKSVTAYVHCTWLQAASNMETSVVHTQPPLHSWSIII